MLALCIYMCVSVHTSLCSVCDCLCTGMVAIYGLVLAHPHPAHLMTPHYMGWPQQMAQGSLEGNLCSCKME